MADPLSITASVLAIVTAALQSTKSLYESVQRFRDRDKTLKRLQGELEDLENILINLKQAVEAEISVVDLLKGPIERCSQVCHEFEESMKVFAGKSKTGFRDWTKMEFMRGGINEFIDAISGYKSTFAVGIGIITMHTTKVSQQVLKDYDEMVHDTTYTLGLRLQRIEENIAKFTVESNSTSLTSAGLQDERSVTEQCLRICKEAESCIETLVKRESSFLRGASDSGTEDAAKSLFEAQLQTSEALNKSLTDFVETTQSLQTRLKSLITSETPTNESERLRLQNDISISKQCLEVCEMAGKLSHQKIYRIGEVVAEGDSDQVVVTTLADLFDIQKALSKDNSAQLIGSMTPEALQHLADKRYTSRFGAVPLNSTGAQASSGASPSVSEISKSKNSLMPQSSGGRPSSGLGAEGDKPHPNEMKKRPTDRHRDQKGTPPNE